MACYLTNLPHPGYFSGQELSSYIPYLTSIRHLMTIQIRVRFKTYEDPELLSGYANKKLYHKLLLSTTIKLVQVFLHILPIINKTYHKKCVRILRIKMIHRHAYPRQKNISITKSGCSFRRLKIDTQRWFHYTF